MLSSASRRSVHFGTVGKDQVVYRPYTERECCTLNVLDGVAPRWLCNQDFGDEKYLVVEYIEGCSLDQLDLELQALIPVASTLFRNLHAIHERGFIHGDVKPSNIVVTPWMELRLIDFGNSLKCGTVFAQDTWTIHLPREIYRDPTCVANPKIDQYAAASSLMETIHKCINGEYRPSLSVALGMLPECPEDLDGAFWSILHKAASALATFRYDNCLLVAEELEKLTTTHLS